MAGPGGPGVRGLRCRNVDKSRYSFIGTGSRPDLLYPVPLQTRGRQTCFGTFFVPMGAHDREHFVLVRKSPSLTPAPLPREYRVPPIDPSLSSWGVTVENQTRCLGVVSCRSMKSEVKSTETK